MQSKQNGCARERKGDGRKFSRRNNIGASIPSHTHTDAQFHIDAAVCRCGNVEQQHNSNPTVCGSCSEIVRKKRNNRIEMKEGWKKNKRGIETKQARVQIKNAHTMFYLLVEHKRINVNGNRCSRLSQAVSNNATTEQLSAQTLLPFIFFSPLY